MNLKVSDIVLSDLQSQNLFNQMEEYYPEMNGTGQYDYEGDFTPEIAQAILHSSHYTEIDEGIKITSSDGAAFLVDKL